MFDNLQDRLNKAFHILKGHGKISEINVAETLKEVRRALINADVSFKIANNFINIVKEKSLGMNVISSINPSQLIIKVIHDELIKLMGNYSFDIDLSKKNNIILIIGLQGSGKTTFSAKIASFIKNKYKKEPLLVAADIYRPAAIDQLELLGNKINVPVFSIKNTKDSVYIAEKSIEKATIENKNVIIIDTAGRLSIDKIMMNEISNIYNRINPTETLFVVDSMTGQDAINTAKNFYDIIKYDGIVLTKLDGDTKGGVALTISSIIPKPIKFVSFGEKIDSIEIFHPERMVKRILGMGDVVSLVERAQEQFDEKQLKNIYNKISKNKFGYDDLLKQISQIKKMGNIKELVAMIPGMYNISKNINDQNDDVFKNIESIIHSMTPYERKNPKILSNSRKLRIAKGSGISVEEINKNIKQFSKIRDMMKLFQNSEEKNIFKNFFKKH